jgi:Flp pilus assembly protein TadB
VKRLRWESQNEQRALPKRPYRDTVLVYGGMSLVVILVALITGGDIFKALVIAGLFFLTATLWSWRNWRNRLRAQRARDRNELL